MQLFKRKTKVNSPEPREYERKSILGAPDGCYRIFWKDGSQRKYCCKNGAILSFFGTIYYIDLTKREHCLEISKIVLIQEGV